MLKKLVEVWHYRELVFHLTVRDLKVRYKNSLLGVAWSLLNPLLMMVVLTTVYAIMLGQNKNHDFPAFILSGLLPWNFFAATITAGTNSIVGNAPLIKKVYFPREALPVSILLSNLVNFLITIPLLIILSLLLGVQLTPWILMLPLVIVVQMIFSLGVTLLLAAFNVFYRDVQQILSVVMLAWFFLTPIVWDANVLPASKVVFGIDLPIQRLVYILNPMASIIATYRDLIYYGRSIGWDFFLRTIVTSLLILAIGYAVFHHLHDRFAEEV